MKFKWDKRYLGWGITAFAVLSASAVIIVLLINIEDIGAGIGNLLNSVIPVFYGFVFAYLLCPIVNFFETRVFDKIFYKNKKNNSGGGKPVKKDPHGHDLNLFVKHKLSRVLSIIVTMLIVLAIITSVISAIFPQLETTITVLVNNIPNYITTLTEWVTGAFASFPEIGAEINDILKQSFTALRDFLTTSILPQVGDYLGFVTNGIMSVIGFAMNLLLGLVISIYCLYSKELFSAQAKKLLYSFVKIKHANTFLEGVRKVHHSFGGFLTGTLIDSFIVACIVFIATTLFNVPFALLVSVVMGITNIIPYFGSFIGAIPCAFLILMEDPFKCLIFIIILVVVMNLNGNVLSPRILGESIGLSSFWVIFALLAGQGIFGFWGLIIGIPLFAVIYSGMRVLLVSRLEKRGLPPDSDSYTDIKCFDEETMKPVSLSRSLAEEQKLAEEQRRQTLEDKKIRRAAKASQSRSEHK